MNLKILSMIAWFVRRVATFPGAIEKPALWAGRNNFLVSFENCSPAHTIPSCIKWKKSCAGQHPEGQGEKLERFVMIPPLGF
jgi:hypothetical protein